MQPVSAVAIFCEDIREEKSGQDILIGILPDNLSMASGPTPGVALFAKLGLYLRMHLDAQGSPPNHISVQLSLADGTMMPLQAWNEETIGKAFSESKANGMPVVGLVLKIVMAPLPVRAAGKITVKVNVNGTDYVAGALNVILPASTVSSPPS